MPGIILFLLFTKNLPLNTVDGMENIGWEEEILLNLLWGENENNQT